MNINVASRARALSAYVNRLPDDVDVAIAFYDDWDSTWAPLLRVISIKKQAGEKNKMNSCYAVEAHKVEDCILIAEEF